VLSVNCRWQLRPAPFWQGSLRGTSGEAQPTAHYQRSTAPPQRSHSHRTTPVFVCIACNLRNASRTLLPVPEPQHPHFRQPSRLIY
jgi:hypothetical protein